MMKTDIEIAQECTMEPITEVAERAGIPEEYLEQYGKARKKDVRALLGYYGTAAEPPGRCGEPRNNQAPIRILQ